MMYCQACEKDVTPYIDAIPPTSGNMGGARFVNRCPQCEQVLSDARSGQGEVVSLSTGPSRLSEDKLTFSERGFGPQQPQPGATYTGPGSGQGPLAAMAEHKGQGVMTITWPAKAPELADATGEHIVARMRTRLTALEAIVPGLTQERQMLRRMLRTLDRKSARAKTPANVVPIDRSSTK